MTTNALRSLIMVTAAAFVLTACAGQEERPDMNTDTVSIDDADENGSESTGLGSNGSNFSEEQMAEDARLAEENALSAEQDALRDVRVFYFEFDKSLVEPAAQVPLKAHAAYLSAIPIRSSY